MQYVKLKDCKIESTTLLCPACQKSLLKKIITDQTIQKELTPDNNYPYEYFLMCTDVDCSFLGSPHAGQVKIIYNLLDAYNIEFLDFTVDVVEGYMPLSVTFTPSIFGINYTECIWDFGDGSAGVYQPGPISHTYNSAGKYSVTLTVFNLDSKRNLTLTKKSLINVLAYISPKANFVSNVSSGSNTLEVQFTDTSVGSKLVSWVWDFGDGETSYEQNPTHFYSKPGNYTVSLTVINDKQQPSTITKNNFINVNLTAPVADFLISKIGGYAPVTVEFQYKFKNQYFPDSYLWNFGDGTISTDPAPVHTYTNAGSYDVQLEVSNSVGSNAIRKTNAVVIFDPVIVPSS